MRYPVLILAILSAIAILGLCGCASTLEHRQTWEVQPIADSPPATCPGQHKEVINDYDSTFFIFCW
jgi:hypothetical protein